MRTKYKHIRICKKADGYSCWSKIGKPYQLGHFSERNGYWFYCAWDETDDYDLSAALAKSAQWSEIGNFLERLTAGF